ncbi:hypothetical protein LZ32DRAFT_345008 [Colletotrichum eremochloae]|nr:hypothetical protein LZ32DRAFT_345008 [Colletotrichum eremochloae]
MVMTHHSGDETRRSCEPVLPLSLSLFFSLLYFTLFYFYFLNPLGVFQEIKSKTGSSTTPTPRRAREVMLGGGSTEGGAPSSLFPWRPDRSVPDQPGTKIENRNGSSYTCRRVRSGENHIGT